MDDLIKDIQERTGLSADKVLEVVTMVTEYMREALPDELVAQVSSYLGSAAEATSGATTTAKATISAATSPEPNRWKSFVLLDLREASLVEENVEQ